VGGQIRTTIQHRLIISRSFAPRSSLIALSNVLHHGSSIALAERPRADKQRLESRFAPSGLVEDRDKMLSNHSDSIKKASVGILGPHAMKSGAAASHREPPETDRV
jgi:hypothetical protein